MALIEINLLPPEKRKKIRHGPGLPAVKSFLPLGIGLIAVVIIIHIFLGFALVLNKTSYNGLFKKWQSLEPKKKEADQLKSEINRMDKKITLVEQLVSARFNWARKLQSLSESIIPGVWLNSFVLGEKGEAKTNSKRVFLSLSGSAVTSGGQGAATIGKFMKNLKENPDFFDAFDEIELGSIQRKNIKETEIMDFTITAYFKKERLVF